MKDIVAALVAKRAAARAGGGEKRHAAQYAKGKLTALAVFAAVVAVLPSTAVADAIEQQFNGDGFSLSYPSHWVRAEGADDVSRGQALLAVRPATGASVERFAQCSVARSMHSSSLSQENLNAVVATWTVENFREQHEVSFTNEELGGFRVASVVDEVVEPVTGRTIRNYERHFGIVQGTGEFASFFVWCGIGLPANEQDLADIEAFVASLSFSR